MSDLRVLYSFPTRLGVPGIGTTAWHQIRGLVELGAQVTLCCGSCERPISGLRSLVQTMRLGPCKIPYRLLGDDRAFKYHDWCVSRLLERMADSVDIIHCWPLGALQTLNAARRLGVKSVLERPNAHTAFAYEAVAKEHSSLGLRVPRSHTHTFNRGRLMREQREYRAADKLACPSEFVAHTFLDRGFKPSSIVRHQYGYDPREFFPNVPIDCADSNRCFTAVFVGRCEPRKGLHYALDAWHKSGAAALGRFLIAGVFVDGYERLLEKRLNHPSVVRLGFRVDVASVMRQSDVLVLPSVEEGSALVTYEARACGCALLVSEAAGAPCEHMHDGFVHRPGDVERLADHFSKLATDSNLLRQLRQQSLAGTSQITWAKAAERLYRVYEQTRGDCSTDQGSRMFMRVPDVARS